MISDGIFFVVSWETATPLVLLTHSKGQIGVCRLHFGTHLYCVCFAGVLRHVCYDEDDWGREGSHCVNKSDVTFPETAASSVDVAGYATCRGGPVSEPPLHLSISGHMRITACIDRCPLVV